HAVLMMLGVPMQEAPLQGRPVLNGPCREPEPTRGVALGQLQQRLNAVEQALIRVARHLNDAVVEAQTISLPVDLRSPSGGDSPRRDGEADDRSAAGAIQFQ